MKSLDEKARFICAEFFSNDRTFLSVIRKALLHDAIFTGIVQSDMGKQICFQGGTALRRIYGLPRLSEDLDFVSGRSLPGEDFWTLTRTFEKIVRSELEEKLEVPPEKIRVNPPREKVTPFGDIGIQRWSVQVDLGSRQKHERVNVEIVNVPAHRPAILPARPVFDNLNSPGVFLRVESLEEILADKALAVAFRPYRKYRDFFDMGWFKAKLVELDTSLLHAKIKEYNETPENFLNRLSKAIEPREDDKENYFNELSRFAPVNRDNLDDYFAGYFQQGVNLLNQIKKDFQKSQTISAITQEEIKAVSERIEKKTEGNAQVEQPEISSKNQGRSNDL